MAIIKRRNAVTIKRREKAPEDSKSVLDDKEKGHWGKISGGEDVCCICENKFKLAQLNRRVYMGLHKYTKEALYRHEYCQSGSSNWAAKFGGRISFKEGDSIFKRSFSGNGSPKKAEKMKVIITRRKVA